MDFKKTVLIISFWGLLNFCNAQNNLIKVDLKEVCKNIAGKYTNMLQAKSDKAFESTTLKIIPIFPNKKNEFWFFEEQVHIENMNKKSSKLVFQIFKMNDSTLVKQTYKLKETGILKQNLNTDNYIKNLTTKNIILKTGCAIFYNKKNGIYYGRTHDTDCPSVINGAQFETSNETISSNSIFKLNQGFDANGMQVWGNTKGEFKFIKQLNN